ncbi:replication initiation protein [Nitrosophilus labii]|uniref:replication initiation protein n=1 Tax=Nitrosophilus labii TaxID=2706014 RepID=UPI001656EC4F|nr:replication initiation protein [Nitrosophilus labii]
MSDVMTPKNDDIVRKSEAITKARYRLNPLALKFITTIIANLKRSDEADKEYIFKVKDFAELLGVTYHNIYAEMEEAVEELLKKPLHIKTDDGWLKSNWISGAEYHEGEGTITFYIFPKLRPYLLALQEKFLQYRLENILKLKSGYVIRLYEILKDWYNTLSKKSKAKKVEKIVEVKWLRETLEIPRSYQYSSGIKLRILKKAQKDLEQHTDITFTFEEIKTGRKITHIKFTIEPNPKNTKDKEETSEDYHFLKSKQRFIAYLRKYYKNRVFLIREGDGFEFKFFIGDDELVYINDGYNVEKLKFEDVDSFFENVYKEAKEDREYARLLANKKEHDKWQSF